MCSHQPSLAASLQRCFAPACHMVMLCSGLSRTLLMTSCPERSVCAPQVLSLRSTGLDHESSAALAPGIASATSLAHLDVSGNTVSIELLQCLKGAGRLVKLDLASTPFTPEHAAALASALPSIIALKVSIFVTSVLARHCGVFGRSVSLLPFLQCRAAHFLAWPQHSAHSGLCLSVSRHKCICDCLAGSHTQRHVSSLWLLLMRRTLTWRIPVSLSRRALLSRQASAAPRT